MVRLIMLKQKAEMALVGAACKAQNIYGSPLVLKECGFFDQKFDILTFFP